MTNPVVEVLLIAVLFALALTVGLMLVVVLVKANQSEGEAIDIDLNPMLRALGWEVPEEKAKRKHEEIDADFMTDDGELMEVITDTGTQTLDDLIRQYDRMEDE